jgi:hypothetical protein
MGSCGQGVLPKRLQPLSGQMLVDILKDDRRQLVVLEQAAKLEQGRCIGGRLPGEIRADEPTDCLAVSSKARGAGEYISVSLTVKIK